MRHVALKRYAPPPLGGSSVSAVGSLTPRTDRDIRPLVDLKSLRWDNLLSKMMPPVLT
ncbi:MAG: hypothetical protein HOC91_04995 [Nitrospinaceae bacterium]|nr:hypothetical protein [Nitrospinaceae bacterium]MBT3432624.1 hypothetical protein [Nitrospinaceae bacterium]MBT3820140.1 hypothetical protein [Nitrospinaceae bacterium]MBT4094282.1 hypothetical protein [Nitrospinaceae bacterium]MBT4429851.1 hypothetical protein [Nitrospinaceae bacterium]